MNIGIMTTKENKQMTGIQRVTVDTMKELLKQDKKNQYFMIQGNAPGISFQEDAKEWLLDSFWTENTVDFLCRAYNIDVLYSFYPSINISANCKKILTIHDMIPLAFPEWFGKEAYIKFNGSLRKSAMEADKIIAMSEYTKQDIIKYYGVDEKKIEVIYSGIQPAISNNSTDIDVHKKYGIKDKYILSVCTIEPRKNLKGLVNAFFTYKSRYPKSDLQLVLTGKNGWQTEIVEFIKSSEKYCDDIILTGYVSSEDLSMLMEKALTMAYVSFYEGFGLPVLEGMAAGKAVISSNTSSLPEVGGDAVVYCNPYDIESIVDAIKRVVEDESFREEIGKRAVQRAGLFSYEKTAQQVLKVLQEVGKC